MAEYRIIDQWLTPNKWSRPQKTLKKIKGIVIHWVANPKSSAKSNRDYFERRKGGKSSFGSAHEIIDLDGDVIRCIPDDEMAYHVGSKTYTKRALHYLGSYPNSYTYGIECTHIDWEGRMTPETYNTLLHRVVDLSIEFGLDPHLNGDSWLHQEVVGWKECHKLFVRNTPFWHDFQRQAGELYDSKLRGDDLSMAKLSLKEDWQWKLLMDTIKSLMSKGVLNNSMWLEKVRSRSITVDELTWLNTISIDRNIK